MVDIVLDRGDVVIVMLVVIVLMVVVVAIILMVVIVLIVVVVVVILMVVVVVIILMVMVAVIASHSFHCIIAIGLLVVAEADAVVEGHLLRVEWRHRVAWDAAPHCRHVLELPCAAVLVGYYSVSRRIHRCLNKEEGRGGVRKIGIGTERERSECCSCAIYFFFVYACVGQSIQIFEKNKIEAEKLLQRLGRK